MSLTTSMLFVDAWGWLALEDRTDPSHTAAVESYQSGLQFGPAITTDYVLDETITRLFKLRSFTEAWEFVDGVLRSSQISIVPVGEKRFQEALVLRRRYADKPRISFTDLTTMVIMRELALTEILTGDQHFRQVNLGFRLLPE